MQKVWCSNPGPVGCDRAKSLKQVVTVPLLDALQQVCVMHRSSEMTIINGCPVSQQVGHVKEPYDCPMATSAEYMPSLVMVTSTFERKVLEWDE